MIYIVMYIDSSYNESPVAAFLDSNDAERYIMSEEDSGNFSILEMEIR